jgi:flavodoxin
MCAVCVGTMWFSIHHVSTDHSEHNTHGVRCCVLHSTGHTEDIAGIIKTQLGDAASDPEDIGDIEVGKLAEFDSLVVGELVSLLVSC